MSSIASLFDMPLAFHFKVNIGEAPNPLDTSFQEVSGMEHSMELEELVEGGENRFVHQLPKGMKQKKLSLKRAIASIDSPLVIWCKSVLEGGLNLSISPHAVTVGLYDGTLTAVRIWVIHNAFPVRWEVDGFNSTKNDVAVETIELAYQYIERVL